MKITHQYIIGTLGVAAALALPLYFASPMVASMFMQEEAQTEETASQELQPEQCGNGIVEDRETCDDGNTVMNDGCTACFQEDGYRCSGQPNICEPITEGCGNGKIEDMEMCDDGNANPGDGCSALCEVEPGAECRGSPSMCTAASSSASSESSSAGASSSQASSDASSSVSGASQSSAAASSSVSSEAVSSAPAVSASSAAAATSSNRYKKVFQHRDDEIAASSAPAASQTTAASSAGLQKAHCGDGLVLNGEKCDDDNNADGDGCSAACTVEKGFSCHGMPSKCSIACGDGVITSPETCDDGNHLDNDGCSSTCHLDGGYGCTGEPSACTLLTPPVSQ